MNISLIITGFFAGIISGMGLGGGIILIPVLTLVLGFSQRASQGMTLFFFIPTAISALIIHIKNKLIEKSVAIRLITGGIFGAISGVLLSEYATDKFLRISFAVLLIISAIYEFKIAKK